MKLSNELPASIPRLDIRGPFVMGFAIIVLFFVFGVGAAAIAPIDKGVGLPGTIIVETKVKPVAHPRGGVVEQIHVAEGDTVEAGALIVSLESTTLLQQIASLKEQRLASEKQLELARQESDTIKSLEERKLAAKSKSLSLQRMVAEIEKDVSGYQARIAAAEAELQKTEIRAPVAGRILSLQVHAPGAVINPGVTVAEIVPESDKLVVEGRLQPNQIENLRPGMPAKVWLTALSWREQRPMPAKLTWISADSVEDKRTGQPHFVVRIDLDTNAAASPARPALQPGMRAEILLLTGQRTLLDQLIDPLMRNVHKAFNG